MQSGNRFSATLKAAIVRERAVNSALKTDEAGLKRTAQALAYILNCGIGLNFQSDLTVANCRQGRLPFFAWTELFRWDFWGRGGLSGIWGGGRANPV